MLVTGAYALQVLCVHESEKPNESTNPQLNLEQSGTMLTKTEPGGPLLAAKSEHLSVAFHSHTHTHAHTARAARVTVVVLCVCVCVCVCVSVTQNRRSDCFNRNFR